MFEATAELIVKRLELNNIIYKERSIYKYGIELFVSMVVGRSIVLIVGFVSNQFIYAILFEIIFILTRGDFGGYHCKSYAKCISSYFLLYLLSSIIMMYFTYNIFFILILLTIYNCIVINFCPIKNKLKELNDEQFRVHNIRSIKKSFLISILIILLNLNYQTISQYIFIVYTVIIILVIGGKVEYEKFKN